MNTGPEDWTQLGQQLLADLAAADPGPALENLQAFVEAVQQQALAASLTAEEARQALELLLLARRSALALRATTVERLRQALEWAAAGSWATTPPGTHAWDVRA
jgi:hypothetical protein